MRTLFLTLLASLGIIGCTACQSDSSFRDMKTLQRTGVLFDHRMEGTPVVFKGQLIYVISNRNGQQIIEIYDEKRQMISSVNTDTAFPCAIVINDELYIFSTRGLTSIEFIKTSDLQTFSAPTTVINVVAGQKFYNTSVAPDKNGGYIMAYETCEDGNVCFNPRFAHSDDLINWTEVGEIYTPQSYAACPAIRYLDGYYYMFYLKITYRLLVLNFDTVVVRSQDLKNWSKPITVLAHQTDDGINNSDFDFTEFNGRVYMEYADGDQQSDFVNIRGAYFPGTLKEFLTSYSYDK